MTTAKAYKGIAMEGPVATWYAKITLKDIHRHKLMAAQLAGKIPAGGRVLEIAPGPGYFCIELARLGDFRITGLDISRSFVRIASENAAAAGVKADFREGDAAHLPFEAGAFDFVFCQAAFKNFTQPVRAIAEIHRVLRPGGVGLISDLRHDASRADLDQEVKGMHLGRLDEAWTRAAFRGMLLKNAYTLEQMRSMVAQTPFKTCRIETSGIGFQVWLEK
ncbi:MAG TPA: class I SAM-dependent methyltransferase [Anaerolineales bacterium]|nr:class I SAM-dependent methyltransferase [Anaerolineales bacterium]